MTQGNWWQDEDFPDMTSYCLTICVAVICSPNVVPRPALATVPCSLAIAVTLWHSHQAVVHVASVLHLTKMATC